MKDMNIFKRLFNWVQSAPADFCYVTGEWGFQRKVIAKPAVSSKAVPSVSAHRSPVAFPAPAVAAARVAAFDDHDSVLTDLLIHSANVDAQSQDTYVQRIG
jgi:hypothetical protein